VNEDGSEAEAVPTLECIVEEDQLSLAIGKRGQNVRLAAALIGARIEIKSEQAVKAEVAQALQRMLLNSQRRAMSLSELPELDAAAVTALEAGGIGTLGDLLDAADEEEGFSSVTMDVDLLEDTIDLAREFAESEEPEPEPEPEDLLQTEDDGEASEDSEEPEGSDDAAESQPDQEDDKAEAAAAPATESPEK
jgi:N utilization substance protein A